MKKIVLTFGLISGAIIVALMFGTIPFWKNGTMNNDTGLLVGYTTMVIALSMVFFGIKSYRDNHLAGSISFGNALKVGLLISGISSLCYGIGWEFDFHFFMPNFMDDLAVAYHNKAVASGASADEITKMTMEMESMKELYKNPLIRFGMTISEILPVGIVISLISAGLLRKKKFLPSTPTT